MSLFITIAGQKLFSGMTVNEINDITIDAINSMTYIELNGYKNENVLLDPEPEIDYRLEERSTARFTVYDPNKQLYLDYGQEVIIEDENYRLFGGIINDLERYPPNKNTSSGFLYDVSAIDYQALADRRQFFKAYETVNADDIAKDILTILKEEGVSVGIIQPGPSLTRVTFNGLSCAESLDKAAELSGFMWFIDENKKFYFIERKTYNAEWNVETGEEILWESSPKLKIGNPEYRNVQYVQAGNAETSPITQQFMGDGVNQTFTVGFPIAREPTVKLNGEQQTVGIKGVDVSGFDWYWNEGDPTITQEVNATPISSSDRLSVTYIGTFPLICRAAQYSEITRQKLSQGFGSGRIEKTYKDTSLKSQESATEAAVKKLLHYAVVGKSISYETILPNLAVGVIQTVNIPLLGLYNSKMLIYHIVVKFEPVTTYYVEACEGPVDSSWEKIFCDMTKEIRNRASEAVGEADVVQGLEEFSKTWRDYEHPNPFIDVFPGSAKPSDVDFPCLADEDKLSYCVLYNEAGSEFFRKPITTQTRTDHLISTITLVLAAEGNDQTIGYVGLWGGDLCSDAPGSGIEMEKFAFTKRKLSLESLQLNMNDIRGW